MFIEDCLELLIGLQPTEFTFKIEGSDTTVLLSIAKQLARGTPLTDRQHELLKSKLRVYKEQFTSAGINLDDHLENLKSPLRHIDRSKHVKVVNSPQVFQDKNSIEENKNEQWIEVRFPFSKKIIVGIENLKTKIPHYHHIKGSHTHYFRFSEKSVYYVVDFFINKEFLIDQELLEHYNKIKQLISNPKDYIPGIYNYQLLNFNKRAEEYLINSFGEPSLENLMIYKDRSRLFGIKHFDESELNRSVSTCSTLSQKIINRSKSTVFLKTTRWTLNNIVESLLELERLPVLVIIKEQIATDMLSKIYSAFSNVVENDQISVLFRLDNTDDHTAQFNQFIKKHKLNNPLTANTKVAIIDERVYNKPILANNCVFQSILITEDVSYNSKLSEFTSQYDLTMWHDHEPSPMMSNGFIRKQFADFLHGLEKIV